MHKEFGRFAHACYFALPLLLLLTSISPAQNSRATSAASYRQRGDQWLSQGELERAIEDYNLALVFAPECAATYCRAWRTSRRTRSGQSTFYEVTGAIVGCYNSFGRNLS